MMDRVRKFVYFWLLVIASIASGVLLAWTLLLRSWATLLAFLFFTGMIGWLVYDIKQEGGLG